VSKLLLTGESGATPDRPATGALFLLGGGVSIPGKAGLGGEIFDSASLAKADSKMERSTLCVWMLCVSSSGICEKVLTSTEPASRSVKANGAIQLMQEDISSQV